MHKLEVRDLNVVAGALSISVPYLEFTQGKTSCVIGKSGSGKSLFATALSGLPNPELNIAGDVLLDGRRPSEPLWRDQVFVLPQEPVIALDPTMSVWKQLAEVFRWRHETTCAWQKPDSLCAEVGLTAEDMKKVPQELSGGMQQRVMIAMALAARSAFVIADEPTKGLDTENKHRVTELFKLIKASGRGLIIITHDLDVARALADDVIIFDRGRVVEHMQDNRELTKPRHAAAISLISSEPANWLDHPVVTMDKSQPVVSLDNVAFGFAKDRKLFAGTSMDIQVGEIVGLYGPSGAGKSTLGDVCLGLQRPTSGVVRWLGKAIDPTAIRRHRASYQKLFQNPVSSFPPNLRLRDVLDKLTPESGSGQYSREVLMSRLDLDPCLLDRRPDQLSGGELQRFAIVRVLSAQPRFLVCDEPSSRLDMTIQRRAIDVIADYVRETSSAALLISHDRTVLSKRANRTFELNEFGNLLPNTTLEVHLDREVV